MCVSICVVQGWGCGYRSVQSLCSWAVMQKKKRKRGGEGDGSSLSHDKDSGPEVDQGGEPTSVAGWTVPSVRGIQEALVEVGDKPAEFTGSREWIGCFEACLVLDHLFAVSLTTIPYIRSTSSIYTL